MHLLFYPGWKQNIFA